MTALLRALARACLILPILVVNAASQHLFAGNRGLFFWFILLYVAILWSTIFVHECGHAYAAFRLRWRVTSFAVFPVIYLAKTKKLKFGSMMSGDLDGYVQVADLSSATRSQIRLFTIAGPAANFLLALIMLGMIYLFPHTQDLIGSVAVTSLFLGIGNLIPWKSRKGMKSDGAIILATLSRKPS